MRLRAKVDTNQAAVVSVLRQMGCSVLSLANLGKGVPDLLVSRCGKLILVEVKDGEKSPSGRKLTPDQCEFKMKWNSEIYIVTSEKEAVDLVNNYL